MSEKQALQQSEHKSVEDNRSSISSPSSTSLTRSQCSMCTGRRWEGWERCNVVCDHCSGREVGVVCGVAGVTVNSIARKFDCGDNFTRKSNC